MKAARRYLQILCHIGRRQCVARSVRPIAKGGRHGIQHLVSSPLVQLLTSDVCGWTDDSPVSRLLVNQLSALYLGGDKRAKNEAATAFVKWPRRKSACICARQVAPGARKRTGPLRGFQKAFGAGGTTYMGNQPGRTDRRRDNGSQTRTRRKSDLSLHNLALLNADYSMIAGAVAKKGRRMATESDEDKEIQEAIQRVQDGEENAYEIIHKRTDGSLRLFIGSRNRGRDGDFINEVAERTHEYALEHLKEYSPEKRASFQTWLNWQSRNVARKVRAERDDHNTVSLNEELDVQYVLTPSDPAEEHERQRRNRVLRQELKALAEQGRLSVAGHGSGRWTFTVTARRLGLTLPQARYRYGRACRELKQRLELRGVRPTEVVPCYGRVGTLPDESGEEDDRGAMPMASLPDGPVSLEGAAAAEVEKEVPSD